MRPPSLIAAACICSAVVGLTDQMCNRIVRKLHKITSIDEVRLTMKVANRLHELEFAHFVISEVTYCLFAVSEVTCCSFCSQLFAV